MMPSCSLQIQGVLYQNRFADLLPSLQSLLRAIRRMRQEREPSFSAVITWGDASPTPTLSQGEIEKATALCQGAQITFSYRFFQENTGYGKGHNRLAKDCPCDFLSPMNPDILVTDTHFLTLLSPFSDPTVGLTEARQTPFEHPKQYDTESGETFWSSGACFVIPTALFTELQGFDDHNFFMYSEDVDLSLRIRQKGYRLIYCPDAPVFHAKYADPYGLPKSTATEDRYGPESQLILAYKWRNRHRVKQLLSVFQNGSAPQKAAANAFLDRQKRGELIQVPPYRKFFTQKELENRF